MERYLTSNIEKIEKVNLLINDIFELSCSYTKSHCVQVKSCDKFERDIFYLDCARFQLEMILIHSGLTVEKFYNYDYLATSPNDDEYRSFSYSFNALVTLWKNICFNNKNIRSSELNMEFIAKSIDAFILNLKKTKRVLIKNYYETDGYSFVNDNTIIAL